MYNKDVVRCFDQANPKAAVIEVLNKMIVSLSQLAGLVSSNLQPYQTMCIEALLTIDVHNRDILSNMVQEAVVDKDDFEWTKYV